jgi:hypothetical protein
MLICRENVFVEAEKGTNQKDHKMHFWVWDVSPASSARRLAPPIGCLGEAFKSGREGEQVVARPRQFLRRHFAEDGGYLSGGYYRPLSRLSLNFPVATSSLSHLWQVHGRFESGSTRSIGTGETALQSGLY